MASIKSIASTAYTKPIQSLNTGGVLLNYTRDLYRYQLLYENVINDLNQYLIYYADGSFNKLENEFTTQTYNKLILKAKAPNFYSKDITSLLNYKYNQYAFNNTRKSVYNVIDGLEQSISLVQQNADLDSKNKNLQRQYISLQPANLYGSGDNFDLQSSHVIPALLRKFHEAKIYKKKLVEVWGSGKVKREFMHADDLARAVVFCLKNKINQTLINVGGSDHITIKKLAILIKRIVGYKGEIYFNKNYPDGVIDRRLDKKILSIF